MFCFLRKTHTAYKAPKRKQKLKIKFRETMKFKTKQYFNKELHVIVSKKEVILRSTEEAWKFKKKLNKLNEDVDFFLETPRKPKKLKNITCTCKTSIHVSGAHPLIDHCSVCGKDINNLKNA